jgi:TolB-like protein
MKKLFFVSLLYVLGFVAFAQQLPTVAVATFDTMGSVTSDEVQVVTELFIAELVSSGAVNVVDRVNFDKIVAEMKFQTSDWSNSQKTAAVGNALNAQYVIRGQLMKLGEVIYWTATMIDVNTAQILYSAREQLSSIEEVFGKLPNFCRQMLNKIPMPNYFVGRWQGTSPSSWDGICILEFKANGGIVVERYDTVNGRGKGTGSYSFDRENLSISLSLTGVSSLHQAPSVNTPYGFRAKNDFWIAYGLLCFGGNLAYYHNFVKMP